MNWVAPIKDQATLKQFKEALMELDHKYYIMFEIGLGTGMQLHDILLLKVGDVKDKTSLDVEIGAKNIKRSFNIPEYLQKIITEYTQDKSDDQYLIVGFTGSNTPVSREQAYRVLRSVGRKIGISSIGAQTMRKTFAWNYYQETHDIYYLQSLFNHASPSITYRFIGEKPNVSVLLKKMTPEENERSRYMLYLNNSGQDRINRVINDLKDISSQFEKPNNDAFFGKVDCLLHELELLMDNFHQTK